MSGVGPGWARVTVRALWYLATGLTAWSFGYTIVQGSDLWWHLAGGRWIWEHGAIPLVDPWSFTRHGERWVNDSWLSDLVFHLWATAFGLQALAWWKWSVVVATFVLLFRLVWRLSGDPLASWVAVLLGVATAAPFLDIRPHLYSLLGYVLLLTAVLGRPRPSLLLPLLFLVWANLHAMVSFGVAALGVLLLPAVLAGGRERRRALALGAACAGVCLLNPNGWLVVSRPLRHALGGSPYSTIVEWMPPYLPGGTHSWLYPWAAVAFATAALLVVVRRDRSVPVTALALGALTLVMSVRSRRFIPLFAVSQAIVVGPAYARLLATPPRAVALAAPVLAGVLGAIWLAPHPRESWAFAYLIGEDAFPVDTVTFVETNGLSGRVFNYYNWGGYLDARTAGRMQVYIDGRGDMVFDDRTYTNYTTVLASGPGWREIVESSGADYVLWPNERASFLQALVDSRRWRAIYQDHVSTLLERADRPVQQGLRPTPDSAYRRLARADLAARQHDLPEAEQQLAAALVLDPHLGAACRMLARVQLLRRSPAARGTEASCQHDYPYVAEREAFEKFRNELDNGLQVP